MKGLSGQSPARRLLYSILGPLLMKNSVLRSSVFAVAQSGCVTCIGLVTTTEDRSTPKSRDGRGAVTHVLPCILGT